MSIAQTATNANLTALVAAATKPGLVPTLSDATANLTVLAPSNTALANPDFTSLTGALKRRNLVGTLTGAGPFTVFAPTVGVHGHRADRGLAHRARNSTPC